MENLDDKKNIYQEIRNIIFERKREEVKESEVKCQAAILTLKRKKTLPEILDFIKENFGNEHKTQKELVFKVFVAFLDDYKIYGTTYGVNATKGYFNIFVDTSTYSKRINFGYSNVPKPDFLENEILYNREGYKTPFWEAYKNYIETPNFNNLLMASKENAALRKGKLNKFIGILLSLKKLKDEDKIKSFLATEKNILNSRENQKELIENYLLDQSSAEVGFEYYKCMVDELAKLGWYISISGIESYKTIYFDGKFEKGEGE